jgi:uncharacterized protein
VTTSGPLTGPAAGEPDRLVETHSAHVLMVGDRVFKWKKPLDLGFVDFRTLASRERACAQELALNRRLAPDVYLGVDVLRRDDGSVREHVLVMRRLPAATRLRALVLAGADVREPVRLLARLLADFHARCAPSPRPRDVAGPGRLRQLWDVGLDALATGGDLLDQADVDEARALVDTYLTGRGPLLTARIAGGQVRDGHGDLLTDDIFCLPDGPQVLDCLDFDPGLRHGDVLGDLAMLVMDLEHLGAAPAAAQLLREYGEFSGEHHPESLAHLYVAYRAQVRAKVALIRARQTSDAEVREDQLQQARQLAGLMLLHLRRTRVRLVLVGGLPGSGKSTVADGLSRATGSLVLSSDLVRRELALPADARYSAPAVDRVYRVLLERARRALEQGWDVVLDASWTAAAHRSSAQDLADRTRSTLVELHCRATDDVAELRLRRRGADHPSDADVGVRRSLAATAAPWPTAQAVDTGGLVDEAVAAAVEACDEAVGGAPTRSGS